MFRKKQKVSTDASPPPSAGPSLRSGALSLDPTTLGLSASTSGPVWGVVMDTGLSDGGWHCLVALGEGSTSLYTSSAFGIIGAGQHETVRAATVALLELVTSRLDLFRVAEDSNIPPAGSVAIRALTFDGQRVVTALEDDLGNGRLPASPVFHAAHAVITQMLLIVESPPNQ
jgi:hypothetical protein